MTDLRERVARRMIDAVHDDITGMSLQQYRDAADAAIKLIVEECANVADANAHDECDVAEQIAAVEAERDALREALTFSRPLVERWCHYQGDTKALFDQYLGPIDAALAKHGGTDD